VLPVEGKWTFSVTATDDQGLTSTTSRRFWVNSTLGFLRVQPRLLRVRPRGPRTAITWVQARRAVVTVSVVTRAGLPVRTLVRQRLEPGPATAFWNGRVRSGRAVRSGLYRVRVVARNDVGEVTLERPIVVRRVAVKKR
jgi:hypothetical protein